jgi:hypothetical protein
MHQPSKVFLIALQALLCKKFCPKLSYWICVNSSHFMLGYQYGKEHGLSIRFWHVGQSNFRPWSSVLGICINRVTTQDLLFILIVSIGSAVLPFVKPHIYVPHLSLYIFSPFQLKILKVLQRLSAITYFDDGMTAVSIRGILWREKLIQLARGQLISWNYSFLPSALTFSRASALQSYHDLCNYFFVNHVDGKVCSPQFRDKLLDRPTSLVIASKWMNWTALKGYYEKLDFKSIYVPHYRASKNNKYFADVSIQWDPYPNLELNLPMIISEIDYCFFSVTSSVFYVLEVLRGLNQQVNTRFIPVIDAASADYPDEVEDFILALRSYNSFFLLPGV